MTLSRRFQTAHHRYAIAVAAVVACIVSAERPARERKHHRGPLASIIATFWSSLFMRFPQRTGKKKYVLQCILMFVLACRDWTRPAETRTTAVNERMFLKTNKEAALVVSGSFACKHFACISLIIEMSSKRSWSRQIILTINVTRRTDTHILQHEQRRQPTLRRQRKGRSRAARVWQTRQTEQGQARRRAG